MKSIEPILRDIPRPVSRLSFLESKLLAELTARADADGILLKEKAADLLGHVTCLLRASHILLSDSHVAITCRVNASLRKERKRNKRRQAFKAAPDWSVAHRVVACFPDLAAPLMPMPAPSRLSRAAYVVLLARVLQVEKIGPQVHSLMTHLAIEGASGRACTIVSASEALGCSYNAVVNHVMRSKPTERAGNHGTGGKHAHLFALDKSQIPAPLSLSAEGEAVLRRIAEMVDRYNDARLEA